MSAFAAPIGSVSDDWSPTCSLLPAKLAHVNSTASAIATFDEARSAPRTHLFVAASLHSDAGSAPVNIRNMSQTGALIDSPVIPEVGATVVLKRGSLQIAGRVAWKAGQKGGVAFCSTTCVADWMSRKAGSGQERVDRIVSDFKAGRPTDDLAAGADAAIGNSFVTELQALRTELTQLGNSLISDVILIATHPEIQTIDISLQRIDRMIGQLGKKA